MWLKYTVLHSDFQPNSKNYASIRLNLVPKGSFLSNIKICANDNFAGGLVSGCSITASYMDCLWEVSHQLDAYKHPYTPPPVPIPQSRDVLINDLSSQEIKVLCKVSGGVINDLTSGAVDVYFQLNEVLYPYKLDLVFKQPLHVYSFKHLLSQFSGNVLTLERDSDNATEDFGFVNYVIDNASIISWLSGANGFGREMRNQADVSSYLYQNNLLEKPPYDTVNSLFSFNGTNKRLFIYPATSLNDVTVACKSTPDNNYTLGYSSATKAGCQFWATMMHFRNSVDAKWFTVAKNGLSWSVFISNNSYVYGYCNLEPASENPQLLSTGLFRLNEIGAHLSSYFFTGDWDNLFIYDSPLSSSELEIINSI